MNQDKLSKYKLTGSVHTFQIKIPDTLPPIPDYLTEAVKTHKTSDGKDTIAIINLNKMGGDIFSFTGFQEKMEYLKNILKFDFFNFQRSDFRMDNYESDHYARFAKLNRYLISLMAVQYEVKNAYRTENLFTQQQVSVSARNRDFQIENYDRAAKSRNTENHNEPAQARLEERTMAQEWRTLYAKASPKESSMDIFRRDFTENWFQRWRKSISKDNINSVMERYNYELERIYRHEKNVHPVRFRSLTDFLIAYQDSIFSKAQLINLLSRFPDEVKNPKTRAEHHKKKYGIEYFSQADIKKAVAEIKRATLEFFDK